MTLIVLYEGDTDFPVVQKLADDAGLEITTPVDCGGKSVLDADIARYALAARHVPVFALRDLDNDAACAPGFLANHAHAPKSAASWLCYRLAVRATEAWLLADRDSFAAFFRVPTNKLPLDPDAERHPTRALLNVIRTSTKPMIRNGMLPRARGTSVGPLYEALLIEFATERWNLTRAAASSPSLRKTRTALRALARAWDRQESGGSW